MSAHISNSACGILLWYVTQVPAEVLRGRTGSGSDGASERGIKPGTTAVAVPISRRRVLTPWVDSFHKLLMPCVDSLSRWDTDDPPRAWPFRSVLSMLMANSMELSPVDTWTEFRLAQERTPNYMWLLDSIWQITHLNITCSHGGQHTGSFLIQDKSPVFIEGT